MPDNRWDPIVDALLLHVLEGQFRPDLLCFILSSDLGCFVPGGIEMRLVCACVCNRCVAVQTFRWICWSQLRLIRVLIQVLLWSSGSGKWWRSSAMPNVLSFCASSGAGHVFREPSLTSVEETLFSRWGHSNRDSLIYSFHLRLTQIFHLQLISKSRLLLS